MSLLTIVGGIELGLIFSILSLGLFIAFRILDLPDLTVDGSFVTGLAISGVLAQQNHPYLGIFLAIIGGALAGIVTGLLHTKLKIQAILAGILTMTALYSINLIILDEKPTVMFFGQETIFSFASDFVSIGGVDISKGIVLVIINILIVALMIYFLNTKIGLSLRATGDNEVMVRSSSINTDLMKVIGFGLTNALVALSAAIYVQYNQQGSYTVGNGMLVLALASIIIGEALLGSKTILRNLLAIVFGSIVYRLALTYSFQLGLPASYLKLFSALIVVFAIFLPQLKSIYQNYRKRVNHVRGQ